MKYKLIEQLIKECMVDGSEYFNTLNELSESYLQKLLKVVRGL